MSRILVVEDDKMLSDGMAYALKKEGFTVFQDDGTKSLDHPVDLVLLDVNLPIKSGFDRAGDYKSPIIFITANNKEAEMLRGFSLGCEDYVTKPFSIAVLIEKVKVVLRRHNHKETYFHKNLAYNRLKKELLVDGLEIKLTKKEYKLLEYFIDHKEQVLTKDLLLEHIWDIDGDFVGEGTLNVTINRLRKKLDDKGAWIQTVFGIGYKWSENHV
ncbi:response regulator transcription factor [Acidaminobacter sp. JC074]|uniref:response regulator transcription factor n=1 Tax=Acidaminobacter sp. JC074 TaxID=2530199 RepID=UPI001F0F2CDA|nr:response regulator transcription factor [Acidaminobacter sp. JC074]MCH4890005.1 response regulator transcription factor [Acidaminobacter sp. JC074]